MRSFAEHIAAPRGEGALKNHPHSGAAGGAPCGDLVRVAVRIEGDRIAEAGFDADGCGAVTVAASAIVESIEGRSFFSACRLEAGELAEELDLSPPKRHAAELAADALHRALGAAAKDGAVRVEPSSRRTLVAMSGGVDSAVAAQLALDARDEVVAVTLELWSDPGTDGEQSCCSPQAVRGAFQFESFTLAAVVSAGIARRADGDLDGPNPRPCAVASVTTPATNPSTRNDCRIMLRILP